MTNIMTAMAAVMLFTGTNAIASEPIQIRVSTDNLDLSSAKGRADLERRAYRAAVEACGTRTPSDLRGTRIVRDCRFEVVEQVRRAALQTRLAQR